MSPACVERALSLCKGIQIYSNERRVGVDLRCFTDSRVTSPGYLAHKKQRPPGTLQYEYVEGPMVVLGRGGVYYERGTPAQSLSQGHAREGAPGVATLEYTTTSLIRNSPPPWGHHRALGIVLW